MIHLVPQRNHNVPPKKAHLRLVNNQLVDSLMNQAMAMMATINDTELMIRS